MFKDNVLVEIYEEEKTQTPPQSKPFIPKPGSIQKNNHNIQSNNRPGHHRSVDNRRRVVSVYE
jgi:hypothetical protein